jgi:hypothetical protein
MYRRLTGVPLRLFYLDGILFSVSLFPNLSLPQPWLLLRSITARTEEEHIPEEYRVQLGRMAQRSLGQKTIVQAMHGGTVEI